MKLFQNIELSEKFKITAFTCSRNPLDSKTTRRHVARKSFFHNTVWWKMLKIKLSFKWYQSVGDLIRFIFCLFGPSDKLWCHQEGFEISETTSKLNLFLPKKVCAKFNTLFYKVDNFSLMTVIFPLILLILLLENPEICSILIFQRRVWD